MNELLDDDQTGAHGDRELTLSTGAILGIFLGLVVLCGACFGVGYNVGHKSVPAPLTLNDTGNENLPVDTDASAKPSPGASDESPAAPAVVVPQPTPKAAPIVHKPVPASDDSDTVATSAPAPATTRTTASPSAVPAPIVRVPPSALMPTAAPTPGSATVMVQVAAVSHQEDADLLVGALRARGYTVSARSSSADNFIHVQVGPFSDKKQAEAMRQRLIADGYNAILK